MEKRDIFQLLNNMIYVLLMYFKLDEEKITDVYIGMSEIVR
jgi:hypothetical protein